MAYAGLLLLAVAGAVLLGPLRSFALAAGPLLSMPAVLVLFVLPGAVVAGLLLDGKRGPDYLARVPLAFVLSTGIFGLIGIPPLVLRWSIETYLLVCDGVLLLSAAGAVLLALRDPGDPERRSGDGYSWLLWAPLAVVAAALVYASPKISHPPSSDFWAYMMYVQRFAGLESLNSFAPEGFSRTTLSGWLLEQAALSRVAGVDPLFFVPDVLGPVLVVLGILAFYGLGLAVFQSKTAALLSAFLAALFFLVSLDSSYESIGNFFAGRITEDKLAVRFVFLPVALSLAVMYLRERSLRYLLLFVIVCWSMVPVHPIGVVLVGMSLTGFGLVHLAMNLRDAAAWRGFIALAAGMSTIVLPPLAYLLATGSPLLSFLSSKDPAVAQSLISYSEETRRLLVFSDGMYIMHPSFLLQPVVLASYVLGVPFLFWKTKRNLAAGLPLGMLLFTAALIFFPPVATLMARIVGPWTLWRLAWPIPPAALLTLGWMAWEAIGHAGSFLGRFGAGARAAPFLPALAVCLLVAGFAPSAVASVRSADGTDEEAQERTSCYDPAFDRVGDLADDNLVLTPDSEAGCLAAHAPEVTYVSYRGGLYVGDGQTQSEQIPQGTRDVREFFGSPTLDGKMVDTLNRYSVDYVLLPASSPLVAQLDHFPAFRPLELPGSRYRLYGVDPGDLQPTPILEANGLLNDDRPEAALEGYTAVLTENEDDLYLAYVGSGRAYADLERREEAVRAIEAATLLFPEEASTYELLADARKAAGNLATAREAQERAVSLAPDSVRLRLKLAGMLRELGRKPRVVKQLQEIVSAHPDVPEYHVELGRALNEQKEYEAAEKEFQKAERLDPRSAALFAMLGDANRLPNRWGQALDYYERAGELSPANPEYTLQTGLTRARLALTEGNRDQAEQAEDELRKALDSSTLEDEKKGLAWFTLGRIYKLQDRPEEAERAFKESLEATPDFEPARTALEALNR